MTVSLMARLRAKYFSGVRSAMSRWRAIERRGDILVPEGDPSLITRRITYICRTSVDGIGFQWASRSPEKVGANGIDGA